MGVGKIVSATILCSVKERVDTVCDIVNEMGGGRVLKTSGVLDRALHSYEKDKRAMLRVLEGEILNGSIDTDGKKKQQSLSVTPQLYDLLEKIKRHLGVNRSEAISLLLLVEAERIENAIREIDRVVVGEHKGKYFFSLRLLNDTHLDFITKKKISQSSEVMLIDGQHIICREYGKILDIVLEGK